MTLPLVTVRPWRAYASALARRTDAVNAEDLAADAMVFAPHPDDETLGCGGTILRKIDAGARVHLVFMTDGRASHAARMDGDALAALRRREALDAAAALGVPTERVTFFDFPDGGLAAHRAEAQARVSQLLAALRPAQVFIPHRLDAPADHRAATASVRGALQGLGVPVMVYEYPVWMWYHWPCLPFPARPGRTAFDLARNTLRMAFGLRPFRRLNCHVSVDAVLARKRAALACHQTQMTPRAPGWGTLGDVLDGRFLACFFTGQELFERYLFAPSMTT